MKWQRWSLFDCNMILVAQFVLAHINSPIKCNFIPSHPILLRSEQTFIWMKLLNKYCKHVILSERPAMGLLLYALMPYLAYALTVSGWISTSQGHWIYSPQEVLFVVNIWLQNNLGLDMAMQWQQKREASNNYGLARSSHSVSVTRGLPYTKYTLEGVIEIRLSKGGCVGLI